MEYIGFPLFSEQSWIKLQWIWFTSKIYATDHASDVNYSRHKTFVAVRTSLSSCSNLKCTYACLKEHPQFSTTCTNALHWHLIISAAWFPICRYLIAANFAVSWFLLWRVSQRGWICWSLLKCCFERCCNCANRSVQLWLVLLLRTCTDHSSWQENSACDV